MSRSRGLRPGTCSTSRRSPRRSSSPCSARWRSNGFASRGGTAGDQALALVFYVGIALGVVLVSLAGQLNVNLFQYLFGSILTTTRTDLARRRRARRRGPGDDRRRSTAGLIGAVIDEEGSRVAGVRVDLLNGVVAVLAALTVALSMQIVGILLIAALMVLPVVAANRVAWSLASTLGLSIAIGVVSVLAGLTLAYYGDLPPGGTIVLVTAALVGVCSAVELLANAGSGRATCSCTTSRVGDERD